MAQPGWYPDPDGGPAPRFWDGRAWAAAPAAPQPPRDRLPLLVLIGAGVVLLAVVIGAVVFRPWEAWTGPPVDTRTARPTGSQWNELEPSETPSSPDVQPDKGRPEACPFADGQFHGPEPGGQFRSTGMRYDGVPGWTGDANWIIDFADDRTGQYQQVTDGWVSATAMGGLDTDKFQRDPKAAAQQVIDCLSTSYYYDFLDHKNELESSPYTTSDGVHGWLLRYDFVNGEGAPVTGDEVVVLVLDAGVENRLTLFHTQAPMGDERRIRLVADALATLRRA